MPVRPTAAVRVARSAALALVAGAATLSVGCASSRPTREPGIRPVVYEGRESYDPADRPKPLPAQNPAALLPPPPYNDEPLVTQPIPEARPFVDAYRAVGKPRFVVFVNRTLHGQLVPPEAPVPPPGAPGTFRPPGEFDFRGPGERFLEPGQYDEAQLRQVDYAAIENTLSAWLNCDGQVTVVSPSAVRQKLTDDEVKKLETGRPRQLGELLKELNADVLVQVQAHPTRQADGGLAVRLVAEAINVRDSEQIGRATALVPPPLETEVVNGSTRYVARRLMWDMTQTWGGGGSPANRPAGETPRTAPPAPAAPPAVAPPVVAPPAVVPPAVTPPPPAVTPPPAQPSGANGVPPTVAVPGAPAEAAPGEKPSILDRGRE